MTADEVGTRVMPDELSEHWVAPFASDVNLFDRRDGGVDALYGEDAVGPRFGGSLEGAALLQTDWAVLLRHAEGWFAVAVMGRDGVAYVEVLGDEQDGRGRFAELVEDAEAAATLRLGLANYQALNRRDRAGAEANFAADIVVTDHRPLSSYQRLSGVAEYVRFMLGLAAVADDVRWYAGAPLEHAGHIGRAALMIAGHLNEGGGRAEMLMGFVYSRHGDRFVRLDVFPAEAIDEQEALVAELKADASGS